MNLALTCTETLQHPTTSRRAWTEVHGPTAQDTHGAGLQGALHCRRNPPSTCQQLSERPMYDAPLLRSL